MNKTRIIILFALLVIALPGCTYFRPAEVPPAPADQRSVLAGTWEYEEDGVIVPLKLDQQGNGQYGWKDGTFYTKDYAGGVWRGTWHQVENDREGGFEVQLSSDRSFGKGRWWYTRIGDNTAPRKSGGTFHVSRLPPGEEVADPFESQPF